MPTSTTLPLMNGYIKAKAGHYLEVGPEAYRQGDARGEPREDLQVEVLGRVRTGFEQIVAGRGFEGHEPLEGVGIEGLYALMRIVHFKAVSQSAHFDGDHFLDAVVFRHLVMGGEATLFNRVPKPQF